MSAPEKIMQFLVVVMLLLSGCHSDKHGEKRPLVIGIVPYDHFGRNLSDTVSMALVKTFGATVHILESQRIPQNAFVNIKSPRYRADKILESLKTQKHDSLDHVIVLTNNDISFTKKDISGNIKSPSNKYADWGIMGLGYRPGPACVVSTFRLKSVPGKTFIERLKKLSVHEMGHNLGLAHCNSELCVMRDAAETIKTIDSISLELCKNCKKKL
jgi:archaemetzincin